MVPTLMGKLNSSRIAHLTLTCGACSILTQLPTFFRSTPLDLGDNQRKSLSPDSKRSGIIGTSGSPVNPILGAASGIQA